MKDQQTESANIEPRIFLVSPVLHYISMTALVYIRSDFGFGYLRSKIIFFAFSWAFFLYAIYAWMAGSVWRANRALLWFGCGVLILYWLHVLVAFIREWRGSGRHDNYSGQSIVQRCGFSSTPRIEESWRLWAEPAVCVVFALLFRLAAGINSLTGWLLFTALCLWSKEAINHWFRQRRRKRRGDLLEDAEEDFRDQQGINTITADPPKADARKAKIKRSRRVESAEVRVTEEGRFAKTLLLTPPYSLEQAEASYHALIKIEHPDANGNSAEANADAARLNEAITFFRSDNFFS